MRKIKGVNEGLLRNLCALQRRCSIYVGLTKNLHGRISWHLKDRHAGKWDKFVIFRIKKVKYLKDIETLIVNIIETKGNRQKGKVPHDSNLNYIIEEILKKKEKDLSELKKSLRG